MNEPDLPHSTPHGSPRTAASCGTWASPIGADRLAAGSTPLAEPRIDGETIYWLEGRAAEGGRVVACRAEASAVRTTLSPAPFNLRSRVHEYGGGAYAVAGGDIVFSNFADNRVYLQQGDAAPAALTHGSARRHADFEFDIARQRVIAVQEDHGAAGSEPVNSLVAIPLAGGEPVALAGGFDFYAAPRFSPDGRQLAWLCWNHPQMPWNGCELWCAEVLADGRLLAPHRIAGSESESLCLPMWSPGGVLFVVSDRSGWWNLYRIAGTDLEPVCPMAAEFGQAAWVFGQALYGFENEQSLLAVCNQGGISQLLRIDLASGEARTIPNRYTSIEGLRVGSGPQGAFAVALAGAPDTPTQLVRIDLTTGAFAVLAESEAELPDAGDLSPAQPLHYASADGRTAHAFFYPPRNHDFEPLAGELPPLIVTSHGGPTSMRSGALRLAIQFWTSRGFAVLDVNYGGSTGFGRDYKNLLAGQWGVVDVEDCVAGAQQVAALGWVDGRRMAIRGGSASGLTTLLALAFHRVFRAGASLYGVSDLAALDRDTHKFESRYTSWLFAESPERERLYRERSPLFHAGKIDCPVIFLQGLDDKVVLPAQSEVMVAALKARGIPVAYLAFAGEGHGFRRQETVQRALEAELSFYAQIFGFSPAGDIEPVEIQRADAVDAR